MRIISRENNQEKVCSICQGKDWEAIKKEHEDKLLITCLGCGNSLQVNCNEVIRYEFNIL